MLSDTMAQASAEVVICGAGIAGVAAAYHLAVRRGVRGVVVVDERPPLTLTSDKSAECYSNWWPGPGDDKVALMNRSIDLLEELARESGNVFRLNRRGYLFATAEAGRVAQFERAASEAAVLGAGPLRLHATAASDYQPAAAEGFDSTLRGTDVITEPSLIKRSLSLARSTTPWRCSTPAAAAGSAASSSACTCSSARARTASGWSRAGWRDRHRRRARARRDGAWDVRHADDRDGARRRGRRALLKGRRAAARHRPADLLRAPREDRLQRHAGRHAPRRADDPLGRSDDDRLVRAGARRAGASSKHRRLVDELPPGAHGRPEGAGESTSVLGIWTYDVEPVEPAFPPAFDPAYQEVVLRGLARMIPAMAPYLDRMPRCFVDGGYYTKTRENRFLAGPLPVEGAYVIGALSGYGMMASNGAADLLADYIAERPLPRYAPAFRLDRYDDPAYVKLLDNWGDSGQL